MNSAVNEIVRLIIDKRQLGDHGIYWLDKDQKNCLGTDIYSGSTGILCFLHDAYTAYPDCFLLDCIKQGCQHTLTQLKEEEFLNGYYCGSLGSISALLHIANSLLLTDLSEYCLAVLKIHMGRFFHSTNHDILDGNAGTLLALLHIKCEGHKNVAQIDDLIYNTIVQIIKGIQFEKHGVFWNLMPFQIKGICGFAHGASGIGFVFSELAKAYGFDFFYHIALAAYRYEKNSYWPETNNYPDFRNGIFTPDQELAYKKYYYFNKIAQFEAAGDTVAWCHGSPGVSISIINLLNYRVKESFKKDLIQITKKIEQTLPQSCELTDLTLCHGNGGLKLLLKNIHNSLSIKTTPAYSNKRYELGETKINAFLFEHGIGLMNGLSGIGYYFVNSHNKNLNNILTPSLKCYDVFDKEQFGSANKRYFINSLLEIYFPNAMAIIGDKIKKVDNSGFNIKKLDYNALCLVLRRISTTFEHPFFKNNIKFDLRINRLSLKRFSNCFLSTKTMVHQDFYDEIIKKDPIEISGIVLKLDGLSDYIHGVAIQHIYTLNKETESVLNLLTASGNIKFELNQLSTLIISFFRKASTLNDFMLTIFNGDVKSTDEEYKVVLQQILIFIKIGIIVPNIHISKYTDE